MHLAALFLLSPVHSSRAPTGIAHSVRRGLGRELPLTVWGTDDTPHLSGVRLLPHSSNCCPERSRQAPWGGGCPGCLVAVGGRGRRHGRGGVGHDGRPRSPHAGHLAGRGRHAPEHDADAAEAGAAAGAGARGRCPSGHGLLPSHKLDRRWRQQVPAYLGRHIASLLGLGRRSCSGEVGHGHSGQTRSVWRVCCCLLRLSSRRCKNLRLLLLQRGGSCYQAVRLYLACLLLCRVHACHRRHINGGAVLDEGGGLSLLLLQHLCLLARSNLLPMLLLQQLLMDKGRLLPLLRLLGLHNCRARGGFLLLRLTFPWLQLQRQRLLGSVVRQQGTIPLRAAGGTTLGCTARYRRTAGCTACCTLRRTACRPLPPRPDAPGRAGKQVPHDLLEGGRE